MPVWASVEDVRARFETDLPPAVEQRVRVRLEDAEAILTQQAGDLAARVEAGKTTPELVRIVLCDMVLRLLRNPAGARSQTAGPFAITLDQAVSSGKLVVTREDRRRLGLRGRATTLPVRDDALHHLPQRPGSS